MGLARVSFACAIARYGRVVNKPDAVGMFSVDSAEDIGDLVRGHFNAYKGKGERGGGRELVTMND